MPTPLKPIDFSPTSRINSAFFTASETGLSALAKLWSTLSDSGEFIVIVAAVYTRVYQHVYLWLLHDALLTVMASHVGCSTLRDSARCAMRSYTLLMCLGAAVVPALANGALISVFSWLESLDMSSRCPVLTCSLLQPSALEHTVQRGGPTVTEIDMMVFFSFFFLFWEIPAQGLRRQIYAR